MTTTSPEPNHLVTYALVAVAGAAGALFRFGLDSIGVSSPTATLLANTIGCLLLGGLVSVSAPDDRRSRAIIGGGFLGALTTYSGLATITLEGDLAVGAGYLLLTYSLGLSALWAGGVLTRERRFEWR